MMTFKTTVEPHVAEYIRGKFYDHEAGAVRFPSALDIYILIYDLLQKRPASNPVDTGNLFYLNEGWGKTLLLLITCQGERRRFSATKCAL